MKKLSQLLESINEIDSLLELDFKDKEAFQKYQAKHKMKPTTKVNIAGKDTTVGDEMGDDSQTPQAPKKTTGADIEKQADKSGKEKDDIEKDIMGDEPKGNTTADSLTKGLKDGGLNPYKDGPLINQALDDIGGDHSDLKKKIDTYGDNVPSSIGKSEAQYQKELDKYEEEGEKLSNDIVDAISDKPKSDEPVKLDDDAQETIDSMDWNKYHGATSERGLDRSFAKSRVKKDMGDSVDEFNAQINRVFDELSGQVPQEDLDKLDDARIDDSEMDDAVLSKVDGDEFGKKIQTLYDFHKKYSTIGKKQATKSDEPTTKFQGRTIPKAPKYDTPKKTATKKPSSLDSYYAKEDAKKKWLSSNPGKTSYDWSRLPYGTMSDLIDKEMRRKGFKENNNLKELSKITTRYNKWLN